MKGISIIAMKKVNIWLLVFLVLSLLITGYIFSNSFKDITHSEAESDVVVEKVKPVVDPDDSIDDEVFSKYVRKTAHVTEFALLGVCIGGMMVCLYCKLGKVFVSMPLLIVVLAGVCDEFIQSFNDRASSVSDVLIDSAGGVLGLALCVGAVYAFKTWRKG